MSGYTLIFGGLFYVAVAVFLIGFLAKVWKYGSTPAPLKIPQTPAPVTAAGVPVRMFQDVVFFRSLFRGNKLLWIGGFLFHWALLLVLLKHIRLFIVPTSSVLDKLVSVDLYSGFVLLAALTFLFILRLAVDRHYYISLVSDYVLLALLGLIAGTGLLERFWAGGHVRPLIPQVKAFVGGLMTFNPGAFPVNKLFMTHFTLVMLLLIYFPFSKLMHSGGIFFSPTRNQVDNPREKLWITPWGPKNPTSTLPSLENAGQEKSAEA